MFCYNYIPQVYKAHFVDESFTSGSNRDYVRLVKPSWHWRPLETRFPFNQFPRLADFTVPSETWTDVNADGNANPGETIEYSVVVSNTGTVSLYNLEVISSSVSIECATFPDEELPPDTELKCFATYEVRSKYAYVTLSRGDSQGMASSCGDMTVLCRISQTPTLNYSGCVLTGPTMSEIIFVCP